MAAWCSFNRSMSRSGEKSSGIREKPSIPQNITVAVSPAPMPAGGSVPSGAAPWPDVPYNPAPRSLPESAFGGAL